MHSNKMSSWFPEVQLSFMDRENGQGQDETLAATSWGY